MTINCARAEFLLEREAAHLDAGLTSAGYMAAWRLRQLAGELMARQRMGESPRQAIRARLKSLTRRQQDRETELEITALRQALADAIQLEKAARRRQLANMRKEDSCGDRASD